MSSVTTLVLIFPSLSTFSLSSFRGKYLVCLVCTVSYREFCVIRVLLSIVIYVYESAKSTLYLNDTEKGKQKQIKVFHNFQPIPQR